MAGGTLSAGKSYSSRAAIICIKHLDQGQAMLSAPQMLAVIISTEQKAQDSIKQLQTFTES